MRVFDLAVKDLNQLVRDWKTALFLVAMPIAFTLLFSFVFSGSGGGDGDPRLPVGYLDHDGSAVSATLLDLLADSETIRPVHLAAETDQTGEGAQEAAEQDARGQVAGGELAAVVIVPAGYGAQALDTARAATPQLTLLADTGTSAGQTAGSAVESVAARLVSAAQAARLTADAYRAEGGVPDETWLRQVFKAALAEWEAPPLGVEVRASGAVPVEEESETQASPYAHSSAGIMVQFAMAGLIGASEILLVERKAGALKRMLTTPISRAQILAGHFLAMFLMILFQLALLILFGQLVLGVGYFRAPGATAVMVLATTLWAASLGLLIGVLVRTDEQVIMATIVTMLLLSGLGGAWMPLEFTGKAFQTVGHLTPVAWAIDGFENIVSRGLGIESVLVPAFILLGYALVLCALAGWRFRFE